MRLLIGLATSVALVQLATLTVQANETSPSKIEAPQVNSLETFVPANPVPGDLDHLAGIFKAYRDNDLTEAEILKTKLTQPAARALVEWYAIRSGTPVAFDRSMAFRKDYPDWPVTSQIRRRSEDTLLAERRSPPQVRFFFANQAPVTPGGRIALAFALKADGLEQEAQDRIRHVWREDTFGPDVERRILDQFPGVLTQADHRFRMERLLLKESWGGAQRAAAHAGKDYELLVKARMAVFQGKKKAEKAFAAVPASLRKDPSYLFSRALLQRRSNNLVEAASIIMQAPRDPELRVDGDEWWAEQRRITRDLLDKGDAKTAYEVASHHTAESPVQQIEAEFHAGWIALRFLNEPSKA
ncbi:MAG: lytic transglycosylase, partial [Microvirga sp.]|nr:lytic transglycosylase [Microvirga sp.]